MSKILLATNNPGKLREMQALLGDFPAELILPHQAGIDLEVDETGESYAENAALKAGAFARRSGLLTLADDSGLEVDALDGAPGLHSKRFSPDPAATDADRRRLLLARLAGKPRPWTARFRCVVAIAAPPAFSPAEMLYAEGICPGEIIPEERGTNGFGYDPVFYMPELGRTMAELPMEAKNRVSHRARAVIAARPLLLDLLGGERK